MNPLEIALPTPVGVEEDIPNSSDLTIAVPDFGNWKRRTCATGLAQHPEEFLHGSPCDPSPSISSGTITTSQHFSSESSTVHTAGWVANSVAPNQNTVIPTAQAEAEQLWACPFYKRDPGSHYRCVEKHKMKRLNDVKQHLRRFHGLPNIEVGSLYRDEQKWYRLWDNLFTGQQRPKSPYVQDGIAEPIALLYDRAEDLLVAKLPALLQHLGVEAGDDTQLRLRHGIKQIVFGPGQVGAAMGGVVVPKFRSLEQCTCDESSAISSVAQPNNPCADQILVDTVQSPYGMAPPPPLYHEFPAQHQNDQSPFITPVFGRARADLAPASLLLHNSVRQDKPSEINCFDWSHQTGELLLPSDEQAWTWQAGNALE